MGSKTPIPACLDALIKQLNFTGWEKERFLKVEENSSKIAYLQGYLKGVNEYKAIVYSEYEVGENFFTFEENSPVLRETGELEEFKNLIKEIDEMKETVEWKNVSDSLNLEVEQKKNELFFTKEKGRDLHFAKGWYASMQAVNKSIRNLRNQLLDELKKQEESLF